jgi:hypothetical protein
MSANGGRLLERRGAAAIVFGSFVAIGIVLVFAGTLTRATELEAEAAQASADVADLRERLEAGNVELQFIETDSFREQQARAAGFGARDERYFRLPDDAPSPPPIVALGDRAAPTLPAAPFDAWMDLLFASRGDASG